MRAYRTHWLLTAILASAVIVAIEQGLLVWGMTKFPDWQIQIAILSIVIVFVWAYGLLGHQAALVLGQNERMLGLLEGGLTVVGATRTDAGRLLDEGQNLRARGAEVGQTDFALLYEIISEKMRRVLEGRVERIDKIRVFLFFVGLLFTLIGVVQGFATQQFPTNPEEAKLYSFTIIKALGLAYLPATMCIGSTLALYVLSNQLQERVSETMERFDAKLYQVAILGQAFISGQQRRADSAVGGKHAQAS